MHRDLLAQARHLATRDRTRPKQANLRRAVSSAYYALFHLLVYEATVRLLRGRAVAKFRKGLARAFSHQDVKRASLAFAAGGSLALFGSPTVPPPLQRVAESVVDLQEARHRADYDLNAPFSKTEALDLIGRAEFAFDAWRQVRTQEMAHLYLTLLLCYGRLTNR